jgi:hypothetical protein
MTRIQSAKLNALIALQTLLVASKSLFSSIPDLLEAVDLLVDLILEINLNVKIQAEPSGAVQAKRAARAELGDSAFEVAGGVLALASKNQDPELAAKVNFSRTAITAGSENAIVARCQTVVDCATAHVDSLDEHGITQAKITSLKQKLKAFDTLRSLPRQAIAVAVAATRALERLFAETDKLLAERVDRIMWQFRESAPDLYDKYQVARRIVDPPTSGGDETQSNVVPVPTPASAVGTTSAPNANAA